MFEITAREDFSDVTYLLEVQHPMLARAARPGQFVIVIAHERGERSPLTIADFDREKGTVTLVIQAVDRLAANIVIASPHNITSLDKFPNDFLNKKRISLGSLHEHAAKLIKSGVSPVVACRTCIAEALTDDGEMLTAVHELSASVF